MGCGTSTAAGGPQPHRGRHHRSDRVAAAAERSGGGELSSQSGDSSKFSTALQQQQQQGGQDLVTPTRSPSRQSPRVKNLASSPPIHASSSSSSAVEERRHNPLTVPAATIVPLLAVDYDDDHRQDSDLSDISSAAPEEANGSGNAERSTSSSGLLHRASTSGSGHGNLIGPDLAKERETAAPPSIEEEYFEYDDLKIATDVAKSKLWRVAGRKPTMTVAGGADFGNATSTTTMGGGGGGTSSSSGGHASSAAASSGGGGPFTTPGVESKRRDSRAKANKFVFADFTVDEVDMMEALQPRISGGGGGSSSSLSKAGRRLSTAASVAAAAASAVTDVAPGIPAAGFSESKPAEGSVASSSGAEMITKAAPNTNSMLSVSGGVTTSATSGTNNGDPIDSGALVSFLSPTTTTPAPFGDSSDESNNTEIAAFRLAPIPETSTARQLRLMEESLRPKRRPNAEYCEVKHVEVTNCIGHAARVKCIAIAPGEKEFVSCSIDDASATLSSVSTGREIGIFTGHHDTVIHATFSPDGKYLATTSRDHTMILWDVVTAKQLLTFDHAKVVICATFSRDARYVATGCQDKVCRVWETRRGRECLSFAQHDGIIVSMSYTPDGTHIASASADKTVRLWSTTTGKCRLYLTGHQGIVLACHCTSDGKYIVSNDEKLLRVWKIADGSCTLSLAVDEACRRFGHHGLASAVKKLTWTLSCVAPGEFSHYVVVACNNRFVYVLDVSTGEEVYHTYCKAPVYCLAAGQRNRVAFGDSFGNVYFFLLK